jgi:hypothetical protein
LSGDGHAYCKFGSVGSSFVISDLRFGILASPQPLRLTDGRRCGEPGSFRFVFTVGNRVFSASICRKEAWGKLPILTLGMFCGICDWLDGGFGEVGLFRAYCALRTCLTGLTRQRRCVVGIFL